MRSAIFVDFDNVFIGLNAQDEALARSFATAPLKWLEWFEKSLPLHEGTPALGQRRILVRRCYLNPKQFGDYRPYFIRAGFETVDCPVLTTYGKTSADVHMVLDILELLNYEVRPEEVILLSADADFTPVLLKLRKWDLRTVVVAVGPSAAAYRAAADIVVDQDVFVDLALQAAGEQRPRRAAPPRPRPPAPEPQGGEAAPPPTRKPAPRPAAPAEPAAKREKDPYSEYLRSLVDAATEPIAMATLAASFRHQFPDLGDTWGAHSTFKQFLAGLDLTGLEISSASPGHIYDPARHAPPKDALPEYEETFRTKHPDLEPLARKISQLTDTPFLMPEDYAFVLRAMAEETGPSYETLSELAKKVRDKCRETGIPVGRQTVNFIVRGITFGGHRFGKTQDTAAKLADLFIQNTATLCSGAQFNLSDKETRLLKTWIKQSL
jgi:hypothetical protein